MLCSFFAIQTKGKGGLSQRVSPGTDITTSWVKEATLSRTKSSLIHNWIKCTSLHSFMPSWRAQQIWAKGLNATGRTQKHLPVPGEQHTKQRRKHDHTKGGSKNNQGRKYWSSKGKTKTKHLQKWISMGQHASLFFLVISWTPAKDAGFKCANEGVTEGFVNSPCSWAAEQPGCYIGWRTLCTVVKKKKKNYSQRVGFIKKKNIHIELKVLLSPVLTWMVPAGHTGSQCSQLDHQQMWNCSLLVLEHQLGRWHSPGTHQHFSTERLKFRHKWWTIRTSQFSKKKKEKV